VTQGKNEFIRFLIENNALKFGDFVLKSGDRSPFFVDLGKIRTGRALSRLGDILAGTIRKEFPEATLLFGPAYKGIAMAAAAASSYWRLFEVDLAVCFDRKESKDHGEGGSYIGQNPAPGDTVVIIDDVVSSGMTKFQAMDALERRFGVRPAGIVVTVDRTRRDSSAELRELNLRSVIDLDDLADYLESEDPQTALVVRKFREGTA